MKGLHKKVERLSLLFEFSNYRSTRAHLILLDVLEAHEEGGLQEGHVPSDAF